MIVNRRTLPLVREKKDADQPHNALLLRSDIHDLFDDYQFSYMVVRMQLNPSACFLLNQINIKYPDGSMKLFRFESTGAPSAPAGQPFIYPSQGDLGVTAINRVLMVHHFQTCLLWHVAGFGRGMGK